MLSPGTGWLCVSTPVTLNEFVPGGNGMVAVQFVTLVQVSGHAAPLIQMVATVTGAMPLTYATSLLKTTFGLTLKLVAFSAASCVRMLVRADVSHGLRLVLGFSTDCPFATKELYLASSNGPLLATLSGPATSSDNARQYIRRKTGRANNLAVTVSATVNRLAPGDQEPLLPSTMLKSHISSEYFVPSAPR